MNFKLLLLWLLNMYLIYLHATDSLPMKGNLEVIEYFGDFFCVVFLLIHSLKHRNKLLEMFL